MLCVVNETSGIDSITVFKMYTQVASIESVTLAGKVVKDSSKTTSLVLVSRPVNPGEAYIETVRVPPHYPPVPKLKRSVSPGILKYGSVSLMTTMLL